VRPNRNRCNARMPGRRTLTDPRAVSLSRLRQDPACARDGTARTVHERRKRKRSRNALVCRASHKLYLIRTSSFTCGCCRATRRAHHLPQSETAVAIGKCRINLVQYAAKRNGTSALEPRDQGLGGLSVSLVSWRLSTQPLQLQGGITSPAALVGPLGESADAASGILNTESGPTYNTRPNSMCPFDTCIRVGGFINSGKSDNYSRPGVQFQIHRADHPGL